MASGKSGVHCVNVSVCGLTRFGEDVPPHIGVGKSWLCSRLLRPAFDDFRSVCSTSDGDSHSSSVSRAAWSGSIVCGDNFLYYGSRPVRVRRSSSTRDEQVDLHVVEHTTFSNSAPDGRSLPAKESYADRASIKLLQSSDSRKDKERYVNSTQMEGEIYGSATTASSRDQVQTFPKSFKVGAFVLVYDATLQRDKRKESYQWEFLLKIVTKLKPTASVVFVITKGDQLKSHEIEIAKEDIRKLLQHKHVKLTSHVPIWEVSASENIGIERLVQSLLHMSKFQLQQVPAEISYDNSRAERQEKITRAVQDMNRFLSEQTNCGRQLLECYLSTKDESKISLPLVQTVVELIGESATRRVYEAEFNGYTPIQPQPETTSLDRATDKEPRPVQVRSAFLESPKSVASVSEQAKKTRSLPRGYVNVPSSDSPVSSKADYGQVPKSKTALKYPWGYGNVPSLDDSAISPGGYRNVPPRKSSAIEHRDLPSLPNEISYSPTPPSPSSGTSDATEEGERHGTNVGLKRSRAFSIRRASGLSPTSPTKSSESDSLLFSRDSARRSFASRSLSAEDTTSYRPGQSTPRQDAGNDLLALYLSPSDTRPRTPPVAKNSSTDAKERESKPNEAAAAANNVTDAAVEDDEEGHVSRTRSIPPPLPRLASKQTVVNDKSPVREGSMSNLSLSSPNQAVSPISSLGMLLPPRSRNNSKSSMSERSQSMDEPFNPRQFRASRARSVPDIASAQCPISSGQSLDRQSLDGSLSLARGSQSPDHSPPRKNKSLAGHADGKSSPLAMPGRRKFLSPQEPTDPDDDDQAFVISLDGTDTSDDATPETEESDVTASSDYVMTSPLALPVSKERHSNKSWHGTRSQKALKAMGQTKALSFDQYVVCLPPGASPPETSQ